MKPVLLWPKPASAISATLDRSADDFRPLPVAPAKNELPIRPSPGFEFIKSRNQPHMEAFKQGLRERGYTEGENIALEYRYAEGKEDRLPELAAESVRLKVDVIVVTADVSAQAAQQVTKTIPIVVTTGDPGRPTGDTGGVREHTGWGRCRWSH